MSLESRTPPVLAGTRPHVAGRVVSPNRADSAKYRKTVDSDSLEVPDPHTMDYDPFIKSQLALRN